MSEHAGNPIAGVHLVVENGYLAAWRVCRGILKSAAIPRSVAPGVDRYRSTAWRRNSCV